MTLLFKQEIQNIIIELVGVKFDLQNCFFVMHIDRSCRRLNVLYTHDDNILN